MSTAELRSSINELLKGITDESILEAVHLLLSKTSVNSGKDWTEDIPKELEESILRGLHQADKGQTIPHEVVMEKHRKRFPHLNL
ncbi:MAG: hypothetical protein ACI837_001013 [Crocinitomicaceae bacterium]|jgi:hypothetical protein